jgi:hypothetical protein
MVGVDFSGGQDAGRKSWIAGGTIDGAVASVKR